MNYIKEQISHKVSDFVIFPFTLDLTIVSAIIAIELKKGVVIC